jgi:ABC-type transporter Mla subunit MlaD
LASSSQLVQLRQQISALSDNADKMAGALGMMRQRFTTTVSQVQSTIGGSARQTDRTIVAALQNAEKKLEEAAAALHQASSEGKKFASTL